jgi:hypothetical protein
VNSSCSSSGTRTRIVPAGSGRTSLLEDAPVGELLDLEHVGVVARQRELLAVARADQDLEPGRSLVDKLHVDAAHIGISFCDPGGVAI